MDHSFEGYVRRHLTEPLGALCVMLAEEQSYDACTFFSGVLQLWDDPTDEMLILEGCIEISRCAFLGLSWSENAAARIDAILEKAINLSEVMGASKAH